MLLTLLAQCAVSLAATAATAPPVPPAGLCVFDYDNTLTRGMGWWELDPSQLEYKLKGPDEQQCGAPLPSDTWWHQKIHVGGALMDTRMFAGVYAAKAIEACELNNFRIGIATASDCPLSPNTDSEMISRIGLLEKLGAPATVAPGSGQAGPAYACLNTSVQDKAQMVRRVSTYYGVPFERIVFFDDYAGFLDVVRDGVPGVHTVLACADDGCNGQVIFCPTACGLSRAETEDGLRQVLGHAPKMPLDFSAFPSPSSMAASRVTGSDVEAIAIFAGILNAVVAATIVCMSVRRRHGMDHGSFQAGTSEPFLLQTGEA